jgi:hypothetical protein
MKNAVTFSFWLRNHSQLLQILFLEIRQTQICLVNTNRYPDITARIDGARFRSLLEAADCEMKGILQVGRYCGLDMITCARLRRSDLSANFEILWREAESKGGHGPVYLGLKLITHLRSLPKLPSARAPLFPTYAALSQEELRMRFNKLLKRNHRGSSESCYQFADLYFNLSLLGMGQAISRNLAAW